MIVSIEQLLFLNKNIIPLFFLVWKVISVMEIVNNLQRLLQPARNA